MKHSLDQGRSALPEGRDALRTEPSPECSVLAAQDNATLTGLALADAPADALVIRPADAPPAAPGDPVTVIRFDLIPGF
ncbi:MULTISPECIES: hypothetical protein [unclassified Methylobacterium]|uniref:hypothetical protein n=1 Tax=unclassified Methylobacterium TaxID=2615210 RepID=UPI0036FB2937